LLAVLVCTYVWYTVLPLLSYLPLVRY